MPEFCPSCFGKLPGFADFVKYNSASEEVHLLDVWIQNGFLFAKNKLGQKFEETFLDSESINFIFPINNGKHSFFGTLFPSHDKSGRKYPFIITSITNKIDELNENYILPLVLEVFFFQTERSIQRLKNISDYEELANEIQSQIEFHEINYSNKAKEYFDFINITTTYKFWKGLFGEFDDDRKFKLFFNLKDILESITNENIKNFSLGLKIPILDDSEFKNYSICFWINLILKIVRIDEIKPYIFWFGKHNKNKNFLIYFDNPPSTNYANLIDSNILLDNICLTEQEGNIEEIKLLLSEKEKMLLNNTRLSLSEFLKEIL